MPSRRVEGSSKNRTRAADKYIGTLATMPVRFLDGARAAAIIWIFLRFYCTTSPRRSLYVNFEHGQNLRRKVAIDRDLGNSPS